MLNRSPNLQLLFSGLVLNLIGGIMYSWVKYHEGERKKREKLGGNSNLTNSPETPDSEVTLTQC